LWDDDRKNEQLHWSFLFSNLIAQWLGNAVSATTFMLHATTIGFVDALTVVDCYHPFQFSGFCDGVFLYLLNINSVSSLCTYLGRPVDLTI
jgi:hypothetical protein